MGFGFGRASENGERGRRDALAGGLQQRRGAGGWRRQRGHRHGAADAATTIKTDFAGAFGRGGRLLTADDGMANNAARNGGRFAGGAGETKTRDQACERNRIGGSERDDAPSQRPPGEMSMHSPIPVL
jgi:hypothetical protein